ncbi:hypothetical protein OESDEN_22910, partial [Oesophagostomum dentatum]
MGWILRYVRNSVRNLPSDIKRRIQKSVAELQEVRKTASLNAEEMKRAHLVLIRTHQKQYSSFMNASANEKLNIEANEKGILVCRGRLGNSDLQETAKNRIFIAPNTALAQLIIEDCHGKLHRSTAHTMAEVRMKYWIPRLRQQVTKVIQKCVACQKVNNLPFRYPKMKDLPARRTTKSRTFEHVGLDYFGPLKVKNDAKQVTKAYGCILTCATTRLIHLELVSDNTTTAFVNAMRRFIARRGIPASITCDNAPTFALGEKIMENVQEEPWNSEEIDSFMANKTTTWIKITPFAPWQGGFYERLIQTVKRALTKTLGSRVLDEDSLRTTLAEIE